MSAYSFKSCLTIDIDYVFVDMFLFINSVALIRNPVRFPYVSFLHINTCPCFIDPFQTSLSDNSIGSIKCYFRYPTPFTVEHNMKNLISCGHTAVV